jgi:hypothetical protein
MLIGRLMTDGRLNARVKCDLTENLALKVNAQVLNLMFFCLMTVILLFIWLIPFFFSLPVSLITPKGCSTLTTRLVFVTMLL